MIELGPEADAKLTIVVPTHNRPRHCAAQLRLWHKCGISCRIIVADSSDPPEAESVRAACAGIAHYRGFDPSIGVFAKLIETLRDVETPFVLTAPDDDVTLPCGIARAFEHLERNSDHVAAHGYVLRFGVQGRDLDVHGVYSFVPTIGDNDPMQRLYYMIRRYQPFVWAVFRTGPFAEAIQAASRVNGPIFQELTFHSVAILRGKVARLPVIFSMRGMEESAYALGRRHPLFWFISDSEDFVRSYTAYRNHLLRLIRTGALRSQPITARLHSWGAAFAKGWSAIRRSGRDGLPMLRRSIRNRGLPSMEGADTQHVLDLIHATWLGLELDLGIVNHTLRQRLGDPLPPIRPVAAWPGWREPEEGDVVRPSSTGARRYIWRRAAVAAEPREEIAIDLQMMADAERQLDAYWLD